jgi:hypothetical protein
MIIQRATPDDLIAYYGTRFDYDSMEAVIAVYDGVIKGVAGVCRWKDKPSIAVTDFHEDVSKKDKVRLVKHSMTLIGQLNEPVWSTCVTDNDAKFLMRLGFTYQNFVGGRAVMKWEPPCIDFYQLVDQLNVPGGPYSQIEVVELIEYASLKQLTQMQMPPFRHYFCDDVYVKEMIIPAGTLMTGKIHNTEHISIMTRGDVSVMTGDTKERLRGFSIFKSPIGVKRVGYFHQETQWINVHNANGITDLDEMEEWVTRHSDLTWIEALCDQAA